MKPQSIPMQFKNGETPKDLMVVHGWMCNGQFLLQERRTMFSCSCPGTKKMKGCYIT